MANGKDGLWDENVGPSLYAKSQGLPVKIRGFFGNGRLFYHVLPADNARKGRTTNMDAARYNALVRQKFASWRRSIFRNANPARAGRSRLFIFPKEVGNRIGNRSESVGNSKRKLETVARL